VISYTQDHCVKLRGDITFHSL